MLEINIFFAVHPLYVVGNILHRPGSIERDRGYNIFKGGGPHVGKYAPHTLGLNLKDSADLSTGEEPEGWFGCLVFKWDVVETVLDAVLLLDQAAGLAHDRQGAQAEEVDLEEAERLKNWEFELCDRLGDGAP